MIVAVSLDRDDIIAGLAELVAELHQLQETAGIRLVGGAALALRYFDRGTTQDLDSLHVNPGSDDVVTGAAAKVARRHGWSDDWLNFAVEQTGSVPTLGERVVEWETVYDRAGVVIQVASADALLAMKLRANRPGRDTNDIRQLLSLCEVGTLEAAEDLFESFYPGDALADRAVAIVTRILEAGLPEKPPSPGPILL